MSIRGAALAPQCAFPAQQTRQRASPQPRNSYLIRPGRRRNAATQRRHTYSVQGQKSMARTHSSHTGSPMRLRSPQRSPARRPSQDGSQYEMDLDALGLNSTFESTELGGSHEPPVDRVDTSEIEGPDDFTMNMTYWMTADLPVAHIKSRKEANAKRAEGRMDAVAAVHESPEHTEEQQEQRARKYSTAASERSMEHDEKVRSFLSALPDTDMEGALTGTPLHAPRHSFLQVPRPSPPKARSLQPTVEDYDTPRKPTQETVIHHLPSTATTNATELDREPTQIAELQSRLQQHELASKTRITELETILSYTRAELHGVQTDNHKQTEALARLRESLEQQTAEHAAARFAADAQIQASEAALAAEMRNQQADFEKQLAAMGDAKHGLAEENETRHLALDTVQDELARLRLDREKQLQHGHDAQSQIGGTKGPGQEASTIENERCLAEQLASVQARAIELQASLAQATAEARAARESAIEQDALRIVAEAKVRTHVLHISNLDNHLQTAKFELECARAEGAAKQQLFNANLDLNTRLRALQSELERTQASLASQDRQTPNTTNLESRLASLQSELDSARINLDTRDQQILSHLRAQVESEQQYNTSRGRHDGLEANIAILRQQLAQAHRDVARASTKSQQLEQDLDDTRDRLQEAQTEADRRVADVEKRLGKTKEARIEAEERFTEFKSQHYDMVEGHEAMIENVQDKAEDAVRKASALLEQERSEKRRTVKDLQKAMAQIEKLRADATLKLVELESSDEESLNSSSTSATTAKDTEISKMRDLFGKQTASMKILKSEITALKNENKKLRSTTDNAADLLATITTLEVQMSALRADNSSLHARLEVQEADFQAVNKAMDNKLAAMLSRVLKERAKTVVSKRDSQWAEAVGNVQSEREILGKILLRQWGREEVGVADEKHGERQGYAYKYVQRS